MTTQNNDDAVARGDGPHPYMQKKGSGNTEFRFGTAKDLKNAVVESESQQAACCQFVGF